MSGAPLVRARTTFNGSFVLRNQPAGANIPLVLQVGRWRRQVSISIVTSCGNTAIPAALARLPRTQAEGDIPLMAFATGNADAFECVLRKMGVADSEFTIATGTGRVHLYRGLDDSAHNAFSGAGLSGGVPESVLWGTQAQLDRYDMVFLPCQGGPAIRTAAAHTNFLGYVNGGGRVLATHFSYIRLDGQAPFDGTASWNPSSGAPADQNGFINLAPSDGIALAQWLVVTGASTTLGRLPLLDLRQDISSGGISAPSRLWLSLNDPTLGPVPEPSLTLL